MYDVVQFISIDELTLSEDRYRQFANAPKKKVEYKHTPGFWPPPDDGLDGLDGHDGKKGRSGREGRKGRKGTGGDVGHMGKTGKQINLVDFFIPDNKTSKINKLLEEKLEIEFTLSFFVLAITIAGVSISMIKKKPRGHIIHKGQKKRR